MMKNRIKKERFFCLGIESTAHTFGCSVIEYDLVKKKGKIISDLRSIYQAPDGAGIHPREASRHHLEKSPNILREVLIQANLKPKEIDLISYSAGPGLGPCLRVGAVIARAYRIRYDAYRMSRSSGFISIGRSYHGISIFKEKMESIW
jgi:N6-L-threonylcarbamoyladenine synthase